MKDLMARLEGIIRRQQADLVQLDADKRILEKKLAQKESEIVALMKLEHSQASKR